MAEKNNQALYFLLFEVQIYVEIKYLLKAAAF